MVYRVTWIVRSFLVGSESTHVSFLTICDDVASASILLAKERASELDQGIREMNEVCWCMSDLIPVLLDDLKLRLGELMGLADDARCLHRHG